MLTQVFINNRGPYLESREFIQLIKAVRRATGWSLRETKELLDKVRDPNTSIKFKCHRDHVRELRQETSHMSINIGATEEMEPYVESLKELITMATLRGDHYVALTFKEMIKGYEDE